jgi:hypothetical protein
MHYGKESVFPKTWVHIWLLKVIGDCMMIINHMVKKTLLDDYLLTSILDWSRQMEGLFSYIHYYYVIWEHNKKENRWEKVGSIQKEREFMVNGILTH